MNDVANPLAKLVRGEPGAAAAGGLPGRIRVVLSGALAAGLGVLPHVLHHAGPLAGAALFAGAGGSIVFGAIGLLAAIPFLLALHRRTDGWGVPAGALTLMIAAFSLSTLVIGPAIAGSDDADSEPAATAPASGSSGQSAPETPAQSGHEAHH